MTDSTYFPFSAIVDQEDMKDALLCNAVNPDVGGVLISGTRGTAKSTAVRSLAHLLPDIRAVADCPYNCPPHDPELQCANCRERDFEGRPDLVEEVPTPFVNLPIGATEDRVLGTIDLESAIQEGERSFEPGLLARANRGILYVDEVNLLGDHLVDVLLDAVASGTNRVEREGISVEHPANVLLVGTMNPEEGDLRPQLLDRFGLSVDLDRGMEPDDRKAVVRRRTQFDADPEGMMAEWQESEAALAADIDRARETFADVDVPDELLDAIVNVCIEHEVDGLRADIVIHQTARSLAALDGSQTVEEAHVTRAAELALGHRSTSRSTQDRRGPDPSADDQQDRETPPDQREKPSPDELPAVGPNEPESDGGDASGDDDGREPDGDDEERSGQAPDAAEEDRVFPITGGIESPPTETSTRIEFSESTGRGGRTRAIATDRRGSYCRARRPRGRPTDLALDATVRAGAPHQAARNASASSELAVTLRPSDLREKVRQSRVQNLVVFVVDSSGSMGAYERMSTVKGAILSLLEDAYQNRDSVSMVGFREDRAETLLAPTSSVRQAARELADLPTGGRTPLAVGLDRGHQLVRSERKNGSTLVPLLVLVTDGRSNYAETATSPMQEAMDRARRIRNDDVPAVCFDTESGPVRMGYVRKLADEMGAQYYRLDDLESDGLTAAVRDVFSGDYGFGG